jgi:hypothetical protein
MIRYEKLDGSKLRSTGRSGIKLQEERGTVKAVVPITVIIVKEKPKRKSFRVSTFALNRDMILIVF